MNEINLYIVLFHSFPSFENQVSKADLTRLLTALRTIQLVDSYTMTIFEKYDLNNDGYLTWNQFYAFASQTPKLWNTLYSSRVNMINTFFPHQQYKVILSRKKNIKHIKMYQEFNKGRLPTEECISYIKRIIQFKPSPFKYDYYCDFDEINFYHLTISLVKKYNLNYNYGRQVFAMKFLGSFNSFPTIVEIDKYYVIFRNINPLKASLQYCKVSLMSENSSGCSESLVNENNQNRNLSKKSILRSSTKIPHTRDSLIGNKLSLNTTFIRKSTNFTPNPLANTLMSPMVFSIKSTPTINVDLTKDTEDLYL